MNMKLTDLPAAFQRAYGAAAPKKPNKYRAQRTVIDGITFASKREASRYGALKLLQRGGAVRWFTMQVPFRLDGGTVYRADFLVVWSDGTIGIEDSKGFPTPTYKVKRREVEAKFGIVIREV